MKLNYRIGMSLLLLPLLALAQAPTLALAQEPAPPYKVTEGNNVDAKTFEGWKTWRAMACERCHGPNQEGLVGPSLVNSLKVLTKEQFVTTVTNGRPEKGMPNFGAIESFVANIDNLYAYLKGRSDGAIKPGHVHKIAE
jgi:mono/diheme cytochrome c family protein